MPSFVMPLLRGVLVVLGSSLVLGQVVVLPMVAGGVAEAYPGFASFEPPLVALADLLLACGEVALGCVWVLLSMVERGRIFASPEAFRCVDAIITASVAATGLIAGADWYLSTAARLDSPGLLLGLLAPVAAGVGFALLVTVMRTLLRQAAQLRAELAQVV